MKELSICSLLDLNETIAKDLFSGKEYPWEVLPDIGEFVEKLGKTLPTDIFEQKEDNVWIAKNAKIYPNCTIIGPVIIDEEAEVRPGAFIRGKAIVGKNAVVGNSTELKNVVLFNRVQVPHYNYVGDSILGFKSHMGAGAVTSNVKSDKTNVVVKAMGEQIPTGFKKFGAILGDRVEVGCNSVLNPGTVIGRDSNIYPTSCVRGFIECESILKNDNTLVKKTGFFA